MMRSFKRFTWWPAETLSFHHNQLPFPSNTTNFMFKIFIYHFAFKNIFWFEKNKCGKLYQLKRRNALNLNSKNEIKEAKVPLYASVNITSHIRRILKGRQSSKKGLRVGLGRICWSHHTAVSSRLSATGQLFE